MTRYRYGATAPAQPLPFVADALMDQAITYFLTAKAARAAKTVLGYQGPLYQYRDFTGGQLWPPTPESIEAFLVDCKKRGLKESSIRSYYKALKVWLTWLVKRGKLPTNPIDIVERPPMPRLLPRVPRQADLEQLFSYLKAAAIKGNWLDIRALALWSLAFDTGLRVGELSGLTVNDISEDGRSLFIKAGKTHADRTVFFHSATAEALTGWLDVRATLGVQPELDALFVSYDARRWYGNRWRLFTGDGMRYELRQLCKLAGASHISPHQLRHAYAVYALRNHANLSDIQRQLGHTNISTTSRYLMVDDTGRAARHAAVSPFANLGGAL